VRIDTAGLQLLVAFLRDLADAGRCIEWREVSLDLRAAARCLGLEDILLLRAG
jgi:ABC-type transporter Mla MlaB component